MQVIMSEKSGPKLSLFSESESKMIVMDLASEIKLITGAVLHNGEMMEKQIDMLNRFIVTGFGMLSKSEITQAFYMNLQGQFEEVYVHYNKELNAEFVGSVLRAYIRFKKSFLREKRDMIIDVITTPKTVKIEIDYNFWKEQIHNDINILRCGYESDSLWFDRKYYTLRKFGLMPFKGLKTWFYFIRKALMHYEWDLWFPVNCDLKTFRIFTVHQVYLLFKIPADYRKCVEVARKYAYWHVLNACVECGVNDLWKEIQPVYY
jgi:hypothetical protein